MRLRDRVVEDGGQVVVDPFPVFPDLELNFLFTFLLEALHRSRAVMTPMMEISCGDDRLDQGCSMPPKT